MNTPVSFEIAKLLKEKGFDNYTPLKYFSKMPSGYNIPNWNESTPYRCEDIYSQLSLGYAKQNYFTWAPTIAEVVMWLYKKHGIWISVLRKRHSEGKHFAYNIEWANGIETYLWEHISPTEAYTEAILHTLKNLVK